MTRALDWLSGLEGRRWVVASVVPLLMVLRGLMLPLQSLGELFDRPRSGILEGFFVLLTVGVSTLLASIAVAAGQAVMLRGLQLPLGQWVARSALATTLAALVGVSLIRWAFDSG